MPWRVRRQLILILLGCAALTIAIIVWVIHRDLSTDLLAGVGLIGGLAIIINSLPSNGAPLPPPAPPATITEVKEPVRRRRGRRPPQ